MEVDLFNGMAYAEGIFNEQRGTNIQTGSQKLKEDILFLIQQEKGKFYPDPEFGSYIANYLFEPMTESLGTRIKTELYDLIAKYYPQITVSSIDVLLDTNNNAVIIDISYTYTDSDLNEETIRLELFNKEVI